MLSDMIDINYKYAVKIVYGDGATEIYRYFYLKDARKAFNHSLQFSIVTSIYLCKWTRTRGLGAILDYWD